MQRRQFLTASLASAAALTARSSAQSQMTHLREFYQLRRYKLRSGPQVAATEKYLENALIPALARKSAGPVGAFRLEIGPETPELYVLIPMHTAAEAATLELDLAQDQEYVKAAEPFWSAPANQPAFLRIESSLLAAFEGWPRLVPPGSGGEAHAKRVFQLRTYESPSYRDHIVKVQMFHSGEFEIFKAAGFRPVFFGDTLVGARLPNLTYMLSFGDLSELDAHWDSFRNNPDWKKLSADPRFAYEAIVSNITNLILSPLACSQI